MGWLRAVVPGRQCFPLGFKWEGLGEMGMGEIHVRWIGWVALLLGSGGNKVDEGG